MKKRAEEEGLQYTDGMAVAEISGSDSWGCCSYELEHIDIELAGNAPHYEGTVIRCKAHGLEGYGVLTVSNLRLSKWTIEYPEVPEWWEIWK